MPEGPEALQQGCDSVSQEAVAAGIAANGPVCFILIARQSSGLLSKQDGERYLYGGGQFVRGDLPRRPRVASA